MTSSGTSLLERLSQPEFTGENRCLPCTVVNVCIAVALGGVVSRLTRRSHGVLVFVGSVVLISLRGYLVPGTPALTKRYFPDWLLARFDKAPEPVRDTVVESDEDGQSGDGAVANGESWEGARDDLPVDPEAVLSDADVVEPCAGEDDLCLTDSFAAEWRTACADLRSETARRNRLASLFDAEDVDVSVDPAHGQVSVTDGEEGLAMWPSEGSMVADLAADRVLSSRGDAWDTVDTTQRFGILAGLRSFLDACPLCDGPVQMGQDTVESCCRSWEVLSVRCTECDSRLLELDPKTLETVA